MNKTFRQYLPKFKHKKFNYNENNLILSKELFQKYKIIIFIRDKKAKKH